MYKSIFDSRDTDYKKPFGAVASGVKMTFSICIQREMAVSQAKLLIEKDEEEPVAIEMQWTSLDGSDDIFSCEYTSGSAGLYFYWFEIDTEQSHLYINRNAHGAGVLSNEKGNMFQQSVYEKSYKTPQWLKGGIMYQIFPDRFCKGDGVLPDKTSGRIILHDWGNLPPQSEKGGYCSNYYFGGNFAGIISKLPYLASLGVTAIYMNPIFEAHAYHRYNTADYMKADPLLGNEDDFKELCQKARENGIRIILDGVFSHTGNDSVYFNMMGRYESKGAYQSQDSQYYKWYDFREWPDNYRCWWGYEELPEVNEEDPDFLSYIMGDNGVLRHWLKLGASGWRLDVTDELPDTFIQKLNKCVKSENRDNIIFGEVWEDASNKISYGQRRHYLEGGELDSVMNYPWRNAVINYIKTGAAEPLAESVMTIFENYPRETVNVLMNVLGTHDTARLITCFAGESQVGKSVEWKQNTRLSPDARKKGLCFVRLASALQYLLPGVPCVYYGDEAGFEGYEDPFSRGCYMWGDEDTGLVEWYKKLGALRSACPVLDTGDYRQIAARGGLFAFARSKGAENVTIAENTGNNTESLEVKGKPCLLFNVASLDGGVLSLPPLSCAVVGRGSWADGLKKAD